MKMEEKLIKYEENNVTDKQYLNDSDIIKFLNKIACKVGYKGVIFHKRGKKND
jgi:hypothetical protein